MGNCNNCDCNFNEKKYEYDDNVTIKIYQVNTKCLILNFVES